MIVAHALKHYRQKGCILDISARMTHTFALKLGRKLDEGAYTIAKSQLKELSARDLKSVNADKLRKVDMASSRKVCDQSVDKRVSRFLHHQVISKFVKAGNISDESLGCQRYIGWFGELVNPAHDSCEGLEVDFFDLKLQFFAIPSIFQARSEVR